MKLECRCHGPSSSCATETCWNALPAFREIGAKTNKMIATSQRVRTRKAPSRDGLRDVDVVLDVPGSDILKPHRKSLVYMVHSPTYCDPDLSRGIAGTMSRLCNRTATDSSNCEEMCCGRGYDTHEYTRRWRCNCRFKWCCEVTCEKCKERVVETRCK
ncbi:predicted protein [Nematostella vectensis]|uniref:Protein Wnt n=2 Tax=Nematostella vectensis TaxID=45351 RepID=A7SCB4_NEMVE|nr:wnt7-like protein [Nematostella vectensis]EDO38653.1 predicted protein [Nematostella vectensis]|eukprot:XP_001630716.1 predicted protein [Nematostella vectensis]